MVAYLVINDSDFNLWFVEFCFALRMTFAHISSVSRMKCISLSKCRVLNNTAYQWNTEKGCNLVNTANARSTNQREGDFNHRIWEDLSGSLSWGWSVLALSILLREDDASSMKFDIAQFPCNIHHDFSSPSLFIYIFYFLPIFFFCFFAPCEWIWK